jgi:hypothetical protein
MSDVSERSLEETAVVARNVGKVEELELRVASVNKQIQDEAVEPPRYSTHYQSLVGAVIDLHKEYRQQNDFGKEMQLYETEQKLFSRETDGREFVPWELYKGACCNHYGKKDEAFKYLLNGYKLSQALWREFVRWDSF